MSSNQAGPEGTGDVVAGLATGGGKLVGVDDVPQPNNNTVTAYVAALAKRVETRMRTIPIALKVHRSWGSIVSAVIRIVLWSSCDVPHVPADQTADNGPHAQPHGQGRIRELSWIEHDSQDRQR